MMGQPEIIKGLMTVKNYHPVRLKVKWEPMDTGYGFEASLQTVFV